MRASGYEGDACFYVVQPLLLKHHIAATTHLEASISRGDPSYKQQDYVSLAEGYPTPSVCAAITR